MTLRLFSTFSKSLDDLRLSVIGLWWPLADSVIFVNENENGEKRENNEFGNEN